MGVAGGPFRVSVVSGVDDAQAPDAQRLTGIEDDLVQLVSTPQIKAVLDKTGVSIVKVQLLSTMPLSPEDAFPRWVTPPPAPDIPAPAPLHAVVPTGKPHAPVNHGPAKLYLPMRNILVNLGQASSSYRGMGRTFCRTVFLSTLLPCMHGSAHE
jgi:hypothetical protein